MNEETRPETADETPGDLMPDDLMPGDSDDSTPGDLLPGDSGDSTPGDLLPGDSDDSTPAVQDTEGESIPETPAPPAMSESEEAEAEAREHAAEAARERNVAAFFARDEPAEPPVRVKAPARAKKTEKVVAADGAGELDEDGEPVDEPLIVEPPDDGIKRRWFAIHAHSGQEGNVRRNLIVQAEQEGLSNLVTNILVPMEQIEEFRSGGEKKLSKRKFFPGYVLIQLPEHPEKNPDLWHLIKDTPGVTGFIGSRTVPVPLENSEVQAIIEEIRGERERPRQKVEFGVSERVKITDGPFSNFLGNIDEINEERGKLKVLVEIFERQTSVEVDYWQVEKI